MKMLGEGNEAAFGRHDNTLMRLQIFIGTCSQEKGLWDPVK